MLEYVMEVAPDVIIGLWRMEEKVSCDDCPQEVVASLKSLCVRRRREVTSTYSLLRAMTDSKDFIIQHDPSGKPSIEGWNISISHTKGFVAVILSRSHNVAVDVEYVSPRINKIVDKFLRSDEDAPDMFSRLVHWCAKETLYKYFSEQHLGFEEMRVRPFTLILSGEIEAENMRTAEVLKVYYECHNKYVLTWCC